MLMLLKLYIYKDIYQSDNHFPLVLIINLNLIAKRIIAQKRAWIQIFIFIFPSTLKYKIFSSKAAIKVKYI